MQRTTKDVVERKQKVKGWYRVEEVKGAQGGDENIRKHMLLHLGKHFC